MRPGERMPAGPNVNRSGCVCASGVVSFTDDDGRGGFWAGHLSLRGCDNFRIAGMAGGRHRQKIVRMFIAIPIRRHHRPLACATTWLARPTSA